MNIYIRLFQYQFLNQLVTRKLLKKGQNILFVRSRLYEKDYNS